MTTTSTNIEVRELDIETAEGSPDVLYVAEEFPRKNMGTGRDYAANVVRVGVDGYFDKVQASLDGASDLEVIDRAIAALTTVRHDLAALDETRRRQRFSLCLETGAYGRCTKTSPHEGDHSFPAEVDEGRQLIATLSSC
jgi:hypothetical protein